MLDVSHDNTPADTRMIYLIEKFSEWTNLAGGVAAGASSRWLSSHDEWQRQPSIASRTFTWAQTASFLHRGFTASQVTSSSSFPHRC